MSTIDDIARRSANADILAASLEAIEATSRTAEVPPFGNSGRKPCEGRRRGALTSEPPPPRLCNVRNEQHSGGSQPRTHADVLSQIEAIFPGPGAAPEAYAW